jgi:hypothetical protein
MLSTSSRTLEKNPGPACGAGAGGAFLAITSSIRSRRSCPRNSATVVTARSFSGYLVLINVAILLGLKDFYRAWRIAFCDQNHILSAKIRAKGWYACARRTG